ncbi:MAG: PDZ domain-containing protein [Kofleriaceae bacterium]
MSASRARSQDKFALEKSTIGGVGYLTLHGTLDHAFEGKKIAESLHSKKLVVSMRDVRRFASWGMSEWMSFLRINAAREIYLVECSTYAVSQINLVTGLLGHSRLVSFYASYRCGSCSEERETLFLVPRDREAIRNLAGSQQACVACGGTAQLEEYPAAFFDAIAGRAAFDIDDEVLGFLRAQLGYDLAPDLTRFRAHRRVRKANTYLRLSGGLETLPSDVLAQASEGTTVADLEGVVFDPDQLGPWRDYVRAVLPRVKALQLVSCPVGFLEHAVTREDLQDKLKIRTFALPYECLRCETTAAYLVDVAENLEQLVEGIAPPMQCQTCQSQLVTILSAAQIASLRSLPARDHDVVLDKFLVAARAEPTDRLENCLIALPAQRPSAPGSRRALYIAGTVMALLIIGGLAVVALQLWQQGTPVAKGSNAVAGPTKPPGPTFERPPWILSDAPSSAYCTEMINRLVCVGVSSYRLTRDEAVTEANDAALEELVSAVGLKIADPFFRETVVAGYSTVRANLLAALQSAELDPATPAYTTAAAAVSQARKRVVEVFRASGGAAVPSQRSDWYWEEYGAKKGGVETLVFVRYDVTIDAIRALVESYAATTPVLGSSVMTAFPALAWQDATFAGGAMVSKVGRAFGDAGIAPQSVVTAVDDARVTDAAGLRRRIEDGKAADHVTLMVKAGDAAARAVEVRRPHK